MAASPPPTAAEISPDTWLDGRRALWFAGPRILAVADLHWGFAVSHRAAGNLVPMWGDEEIAARLSSLITDYQPAEVIWLGDSIHALPGRAAAERYLALPGTPPTLVIAGNHDRRWAAATEWSAARGSLFFHHGDRNLPVPEGAVEVTGHHHPAVSWSDGAGGNVKLPALVAGPRRLILPAFSPWAAGTPWNGRLTEGESLWAISPRRVFQIIRPA